MFCIKSDNNFIQYQRAGGLKPTLFDRIDLLFVYENCMICLLVLGEQDKLPDNEYKLEAQGPCTWHRTIIAILHCFDFGWFVAFWEHLNFLC